MKLMLLMSLEVLRFLLLEGSTQEVVSKKFFVSKYCSLLLSKDPLQEPKSLYGGKVRENKKSRTDPKSDEDFVRRRQSKRYVSLLEVKVSQVTDDRTQITTVVIQFQGKVSRLAETLFPHEHRHRGRDIKRDSHQLLLGNTIDFALNLLRKDR